MSIFSIIIPTYNSSKTIGEAIESVTNQTSEKWELIIVDDGSTDSTREIITPFLSKNVYYYYQDNRGVSAARNYGFAQSSGSFVLFLDSDDSLKRTLIQELSEFTFHNYDLITWDVLRYVDGKRTYQKAKKLSPIYNGIRANFLAGSVCYKREVFEEVGGYDEKISFGENYELGLRVSKLNPDVLYIPKAYLLIYVINNVRTSNSIQNRLPSTLYQYKKHKETYISDAKNNSNINYIIGYLLENNGNTEEAYKYYLASWKANVFNFKAFLKVTLFRVLFRR